MLPIILLEIAIQSKVAEQVGMSSTGISVLSPRELSVVQLVDGQNHRSLQLMSSEILRTLSQKM